MACSKQFITKSYLSVKSIQSLPTCKFVLYMITVPTHEMEHRVSILCMTHPIPDLDLNMFQISSHGDRAATKLLLLRSKILLPVFYTMPIPRCRGKSAVTGKSVMCSAGGP